MKTLKKLEIVGHDVVRDEAIKHIKDALKKRKNMFKAWMHSMDITEETIRRYIQEQEKGGSNSSPE